jgi:tRNA threonylcarbamoyl adenosine modification protein (Sua5/YciO/YrdC/YwlC family)
MMISLLENWDRAFENAVKAIKEKKVVVYPTDTAYNIGSALDEGVADKIEKITGTEPSCVIIANLEMLLKYFDLDDEEKKYITQNCPGPYVFMLKPKSKMGIEDTKGNIGVMIPNHIFIRKVCFESNVPIIAVPCVLENKEIVEKIDLVIESGKATAAKEPTVINIRERRIEKQGAGEFNFE